jgi:hypothetical protein
MSSLIVLVFLAGIVAGAVLLANMPKPSAEKILNFFDQRSPK